MQLNILAFGIAKDIFAGPSVMVEVPDGGTVMQVKHVLEDRYPRLKLLASYLLAVNSNYAEDGLTLTPTDEVAIIPPVSGG